MIRYQSLMLLFVLMGCKSAQTDLPLLQNCPEGGDCEVQVFKDTKLFIREDSLEISKISFEEDKDFQVIFIKYKDSNIEDYSEEIYLQIPSRFKEIQSKNQSLQNQKLILGKICDCEDSGFERINHGQLHLVNHKDYTTLHLELESGKKHIFKSIDLDI